MRIVKGVPNFLTRILHAIWHASLRVTELQSREILLAYLRSSSSHTFRIETKINYYPPYGGTEIMKAMFVEYEIEKFPPNFIPFKPNSFSYRKPPKKPFPLLRGNPLFERPPFLFRRVEEFEIHGRLGEEFPKA